MFSSRKKTKVQERMANQSLILSPAFRLPDETHHRQQLILNYGSRKVDLTPKVLVKLILGMLVGAAAFSHSGFPVEMVPRRPFGHGNGVADFQSRCHLSGSSVGNPAQHNEGPALQSRLRL